MSRILLQFFIAVIATMFLLGCEDSDSDSNKTVDKTYNGPGSKWDVVLYNDDSFSITRRETYQSPIQMTVNGDYQTLDSGFFLLTVSDSTTADNSTGPAAGEQAFALEIPGYAFILKPIDGSDQVIPMVTAGECPSADFNANWVAVSKVSGQAADDADADLFGRFAYTATSATAGNAILPNSYALTSGNPDRGSFSLGSGNCANGLMEIGGALMYLTSNGGAIVQPQASVPDADGEMIFALGEKAITSIATLDGEYAGLLFDGNMTTGEQILPVSLTCTSGTCAAALVTDVVNNVVSTTETASLNLTGTINDLGDGLVVGTVTAGVDSGSIACMVDENVLSTGRKLISCVGQSPGDNTELFNVLFTSKI